LEEFTDNIEILSIHDVLCGKSAAVCRKAATFCATHDAAADWIDDSGANVAVSADI